MTDPTPSSTPLPDSINAAPTGGSQQLALPFHRSLLLKHAVFVALLVTLAAGALGHLAYVFSQGILRRNVHDRLTLVAEERTRLLETAFTVRLQQVNLIATRSELSQLLQENIEGRIDRSQLESGVRGVLDSVHRTAEGFRKICVADVTGNVLACAGEPRRTESFAGEPLFESGLHRARIGRPEREGPRYVAWASAPLRPGERETAAVLMVELDFTALVTAILDPTDIGETGKVVVGWPAEGGLHYVTKASSQPVGPDLADLVRKASGGRADTRVESIAGDEVVASLRPIAMPDNDGLCGLVVLIDDVEAYAPVRRLRWNLFLLQAALVVVGVAASFWVARRLTRPINRLASTAVSIAAGNHDHRAAVTSRDEIGLLAASFNQMTEQLVAAHDQLEQRVEERTAELNASQRELKKNARILQSVLDSMADGVIVSDVAGKFIVWNSAADRIIGIGPVEAEPDEWARIYGCYLSDGNTRCPPEELPLARAIRGESLDNFELFIRNASIPEGVWISVNARPLRNGAGELRGGVAVFRDITQAKRVHEVIQARDDLNRTILATAHEAFVAIDRHSIIRQWNEQAEHTFGWTAEEAIGRRITETIVPERFAGAHLDGVERFFRTGEGPLLNRRLELTARHRDGHEFPVELTIGPVWQGNSYIFAAFIHDVSEQKQARRDLVAAREKAEAGSRAKSEFLANMSHEIRTPLNAIIGMTELVLDTKLSPTQRDYLQMVQESGESLLNVINDILDFSKIEAGRFDLDEAPFDLREVLGDTMKTMAVRAHRKGIELAFHVEPDIPRTLIGDRHRLRQLIVNLVGNAVKFTDEGEVVLDVSREQPAEPSESSSNAAPVDGPPDEAPPESQGSPTRPLRLHFCVTDTGVGIPADKRHKLFKPFEQVDESSTRRFTGTGLGLAICARLVALMDGRIWVESEEGEGSTFHFTAEFGTSADAEPARRDREEVLHGVRVLVVDDNRTNRRILDEVLRNWGMHPTTASSGRAALDILRRELDAGMPFDVVLVDGHMPGMDGFMLMEKIRDDAAFDRLGAVMLTSSGSRDPVRNERLRIAACLTKPVKQSELFDAVCDCLGAARLPEEVSEQDGQVEAGRVRPLRILLAEDNVVNQKLALGLLEPHGHTVTVVENGVQAVAAWEQGNFDLILMDVQMPEMDGLEATRTIRARERARGPAAVPPDGWPPHIPILAMTAHAIKGDREECLEAGMDEYISKPVRRRDLFAAMERILARHAAPPATPSESPPTVPGKEAASASAAAAPAQRAEATAGGNGAPREPSDRPIAPAAFDWNAAVARSDLTETDFRELAELFLRQCPDLIAEIHQAFAEKDSVHLRRAAHTLKGSEAIFVRNTSDSAAYRLETAARNEDFEAASRLIPTVEAEATALVAAIASHLEQPDAAATQGA